MPNLVVTGALGFVCSTFVNMFRSKHMDWNIFIVDKESAQSDRRNIDHALLSYKDWLAQCKPKYVSVLIKEDLAKGAYLTDYVVEKEGCDLLIHGAAESHVCRSIDNPNQFIESNVLGTTNILNVVKNNKINRHVWIQTDEIFGPHTGGVPFNEFTKLSPSSPYSSSKAAAALITESYIKTYRINGAVRLNPTNMFGPRQNSEKLIPRSIGLLKEGKKVPLFGDGFQRRDWLFVEDFCNILEMLCFDDVEGVFNIAGNNEQVNKWVVNTIYELMFPNKIHSLEDIIEYVEDRPAHDERYFIDDSRLRDYLGARCPKPTDFTEALKKTIEWYTTTQN